jgi:polyisoprenoid-binding protein YceI
MKKTSTIVQCIAAALAISFTASARLVDAGDADVGFLATGPGGLHIRGSGDGLSAREEDGNVLIRVPVTNLKTGIALRDQHLRKYIEARRYSSATLEVSRSKLKFPANDKKSTGRAKGTFTLHGVSRELEFDYSAARTGSDYHVQALATIDITDHRIEQPCYLGLCVDTKVKLKVKFKLREQ